MKTFVCYGQSCVTPALIIFYIFTWRIFMRETFAQTNLFPLSTIAAFQWRYIFVNMSRNGTNCLDVFLYLCQRDKLQSLVPPVQTFTSKPRYEKSKEIFRPYSTCKEEVRHKLISLRFETKAYVNVFLNTTIPVSSS